uniref:Uncharacterized protein n=1 Tax=Vespula pensylvanica TaxID=30213 RepID=A0A834KIU2_VESPE|nr:hypothetical protein H0235_014317 [Vespula pensylvanica]
MLKNCDMVFKNVIGEFKRHLAGKSNNNEVTLHNVDFALSGTFSCEVTADAPTFSTASATKNLTVVFGHKYLKREETLRAVKHSLARVAEISHENSLSDRVTNDTLTLASP